MYFVMLVVLHIAHCNENKQKKLNTRTHAFKRYFHRPKHPTLWLIYVENFANAFPCNSIILLQFEMLFSPDNENNVSLQHAREFMLTLWIIMQIYVQQLFSITHWLERKTGLRYQLWIPWWALTQREMAKRKREIEQSDGPMIHKSIHLDYYQLIWCHITFFSRSISQLLKSYGIFPSDLLWT